RVDEDASFVLADVPGLIPGAHAGQGLGTRFLRHLSRTAVLVHLLGVSGLTGRDPVDDYDVLCRELTLASPALGTKPQIVVAGRVDLGGAGEGAPRGATRGAGGDARAPAGGARALRRARHRRARDLGRHRRRDSRARAPDRRRRVGPAPP